MPPAPLHHLQSPGPASGPCTPSTQNSVSLGAFCTPSTRNSVSLWAFAHPPFCVPRGLDALSRRNSVAPRTFAHPSLRIPCPSRLSAQPPLKTPGPRHRLGPLFHPGSCLRGLSGCRATMLPADSYHPEPPAQLSSVLRSLALSPTQDTCRVVGTLVLPCPAQCPVSSFPAHSQSL